MLHLKHTIKTDRIEREKCTNHDIPKMKGNEHCTSDGHCTRKDVFPGVDTCLKVLCKTTAEVSIQYYYILN